MAAVEVENLLDILPRICFALIRGICANFYYV